MRVLLINGSLRQGDACAAAVRRAAERLEAAGADAAIFWPVKTENLACSGCGACRGKGMCVADPRAAEFLKAAAEYDALLFVVPVGLFGPGVDVKNFLERVAELNRRQQGRPLAGKCAAALTAGRRSERNAARVRDLLSAFGLSAPAEDGSKESAALCGIIKEEWL